MHKDRTLLKRWDRGKMGAVQPMPEGYDPTHLTSGPNA